MPAIIKMLDTAPFLVALDMYGKKNKLSIIFLNVLDILSCPPHWNMFIYSRWNRVIKITSCQEQKKTLTCSLWVP